MRGREEFLASAITSAFGGPVGGGGIPVERERGAMGGYVTRVSLRKCLECTENLGSSLDSTQDLLDIDATKPSDPCVY